MMTVIPGASSGQVDLVVEEGGRVGEENGRCPTLLQAILYQEKKNRFT
jgi:hypothetical protein